MTCIGPPRGVQVSLGIDGLGQTLRVRGTPQSRGPNHQHWGLPPASSHNPHPAGCVSNWVLTPEPLPPSQNRSSRMHSRAVFHNPARCPHPADEAAPYTPCTEDACPQASPSVTLCPAHTCGTLAAASGPSYPSATLSLTFSGASLQPLSYETESGPWTAPPSACTARPCPSTHLDTSLLLLL